MKKTIFFIAAILIFAGETAEAQQAIRVGYVDMDYILENIPEYQEASAQLDSKVQKWKAEIEAELNRIESMKETLENERALLTNELIEEREEEIAFEEQKVYDYQQKRFGPSGDMMTQKLQLVKPIQDQVFIAVQEIAESRNYDLIFDKSADAVTLFASESLDVSDQVLRSITRASNREQLSSRQEREELIREEAKTVEQSAEVSSRQAAREERQRQRDSLLQERKRVRDSIRTARQQEYENRRKKLLEDRERKKDSIARVREQENE